MQQSSHHAVKSSMISYIATACYLQYKDLLQLMIDATVEESSSNKKKLTDEQITDHAITFMMAGYETTANALSYTAYLLALNPSAQEKLQDEIDAFFKENPVIMHTHIWHGVTCWLLFPH